MRYETYQSDNIQLFTEEQGKGGEGPAGDIDAEKDEGYAFDLAETVDLVELRAGGQLAACRGQPS